MQYGFNINPLPNPDHFFKDEETLNLEGYQMIVHHTSGHTPGHVVFSIPAVKAIFCGDLIFANGIGRTDLTGGDQVELIKSIQQKILIYPDDTRLFTGHGSETTVGIEKRSNPYLK